MLLSSETQASLILYVPTTYNEVRDFDRLLNLWVEVEELPQDKLDIKVDFHYCEFLGHNGVAFLGGLAKLVEFRGGNIVFDWDTLPHKIRINLAQNGFLNNFGCDWEPWSGNSIPYRSDSSYDSTAITNYLRYNWLGKGWLNICPQLQEAIAGEVLEIYINAFEHSQSEIGVFSCGQHYPKAELLELTVVDLGIGIPNSVRSLAQNSSMTTNKALEWAFQPGNSTKTGKISQGAGLDLLKTFVSKNHGSLKIFSNDACAIISDNGISFENKSTNFLGTLINIAFRCDESYYHLASEALKSSKQLF